MKYLPLIWSGIWRRKGRTTLIMLQIAMAFLLYGLLQGFKGSLDDMVARLDADLFVVQRANGFAPLPMSMFERIKGVPGVKSVTYQSTMGATYQRPGQQVLVLANDVSTVNQTFPGMSVSPEDIAAMKRTRTGAIATIELAAHYGWKVGDRIPLQSPVGAAPGSMRDWAFDLVGIFDPGSVSNIREYLYVNYDYFDEARLDNRGTVGAFYIRIADARNPLPTAVAIDKLFSNSADETSTNSYRDMVESQVQSIGDLAFVIRAVVGAVLFALLFSVGAMMMQSIRERTPELAVWKTVGFSDRRVCAIVFIEALLLCIVSALIGLGLSAVLLPLGKNLMNMKLVLSNSVLIIGVSMAVGLAVLSAAMPVWRSLHLRVVDALAGR